MEIEGDKAATILKNAIVIIEMSFLPLTYKGPPPRDFL